MDLQDVNEQYNNFISQFNSVVLATTNSQGIPNASYAPFVIDEQKHIYIYISNITKHYNNLQDNGRVSVLFVADEQSSEQIFARHRLTYDCTAHIIERSSATYTKAITMFDDKFGADVAMLHQMDDFDIFVIIPQQGLLVLGFGKAYAINSNDLSKVTHLKGIGGKGHTFKKRT